MFFWRDLNPFSRNFTGIASAIMFASSRVLSIGLSLRCLTIAEAILPGEFFLSVFKNDIRKRFLGVGVYDIFCIDGIRGIHSHVERSTFL